MKIGKNALSFEDILAKGFQADNGTKNRIQISLQKKLDQNPYRRIYWGLAFGSLFLFIGISVFLHKPVKGHNFGPYSLYIEQNFPAQNFGESGPRGLETMDSYIDFR